MPRARAATGASTTSDELITTPRYAPVGFSVATGAGIRMLNRLEHVALAVSDLDAAIAHYEEAWGLQVTHRERVEDQDVEEAMLPLGDSFLQLLAPTSPRSTVARFIERSGEGLHHLAYEVDDLEAALESLKNKGVRLIDDAPRRGGRGHMVAFVHPKSNQGVLVELIQKPRPA